MEEFDVNRYFHRLRERVASYAANSPPRQSASVVAAFNALQGSSPCLSAIQSICFLGLPEDVIFLRAIYWKLILRYLPSNKTEWPKVLAEKRAVYFSAVERFIKEPKYISHFREAIKHGIISSYHVSSEWSKTERQSTDNTIKRSTVDNSSDVGYIDLLSDEFNDIAINEDNSAKAVSITTQPLSRRRELSLNRTPLPKDIVHHDPLTVSLKKQKSRSVNTLVASPLHDCHDDINILSESFEKDAEIFDQINKDVFRTRAEVPFFSSPLDAIDRQDFPLSNVPDNMTQRVIDMIAPKVHVDILGRILFIYSKLHPSLKYIQGMNELLAPIFFVIFSDPLLEDVEQAEVDAFFCFSALLQMNGQFELFCRVFDKDQLGVLGRVKYLGRLLEFQDPQLHSHFGTINLDLQFFALRWILLLFTQEFSLPDLMRLWDSLLADGYDSIPHDTSLLYFICLAVLDQLRTELLDYDFSTSMKLLQNLPSFDPQNLVSKAVVLRQSFESAKPSWLLYLSSKGNIKSLHSHDQSDRSQLGSDIIVDTVMKVYNGIVSSSEAKDVKEMAANLSSVGADYAKSAVKSIHHWFNTTQFSARGSPTSRNASDDVNFTSLYSPLDQDFLQPQYGSRQSFTGFAINRSHTTEETHRRSPSYPSGVSCSNSVAVAYHPPKENSIPDEPKSNFSSVQEKTHDSSPQRFFPQRVQSQPVISDRTPPIYNCNQSSSYDISSFVRQSFLPCSQTPIISQASTPNIYHQHPIPPPMPPPPSLEPNISCPTEDSTPLTSSVAFISTHSTKPSRNLWGERTLNLSDDMLFQLDVSCPTQDETNQKKPIRLLEKREGKQKSTDRQIMLDSISPNRDFNVNSSGCNQGFELKLDVNSNLPNRQMNLDEVKFSENKSIQFTPSVDGPL